VFPLPRPRNSAIKRTSEFVALVDRAWRMIEDDLRTLRFMSAREIHASFAHAKLP
jgi:hypothetical protein